MSIISNLSVKIIIIFLTIELIFVTANIDNATNNDTDFVFLVTGGYRPPKHTLTKYLVSLRRPVREYWGDNHLCGGSIISPRIILTAAHCLTNRKSKIPKKARDVKVVAKATNRLVETADTLELSVEEIRVHPSYDPKIIAHDIGIAKVAEDIDMDGSLAAIIPLIDRPVEHTTHCTVLGWGRIFQNGPLAAEAIYADVDIWLIIFCSVFPNFNEGMLCVGNLKDPELDACTGDSGGPLICDSKLVGVVSFGIGCASGLPGVYSDVWYYRKWIRENHCNRHADNGFLILFATFMFMVF